MKITIKTRLGDVIGLQHENHQEFLGIRYAKPPIGDLRFESPMLIDSWQPPYEATTYGPMCYQGNVDDPPIKLQESEDCLLLNIYTPNADEENRLVMVYIHGGGYTIGSASRPRLHGATLAIKGNIVVVSIQYRLGVLGFLNHEGVSSNLGLQDQICALQWIQKNIEDYGGDPNNVTIFGQSAGSMSVEWLMLSPKASGLFQKAIGQSGAIGFDQMEKELKNSRKTADKYFKCLKIPQNDIITLKSIPIEQLIKAELEMLKDSFLTDRNFFPFPDGDVIPFDYKKAWTEGHAKNIPFIIGMNAEELPLFSSGMISGNIKQWYIKTLISKGLRKEMGVSKAQFNELLASYKNYYPISKYPKYADYEAILADIAFWVFTNRLAELHSSLNSTYVYWFNYKAPKINASPHCFELLFVFGDITNKDYAKGIWLEGTKEERNLSEQIMDAWISFARSGDPNHKGLPEWPKFDPVKRRTMFFDVPCRIIDAPREEIRLAWEKIQKT
jgi:para-nitrobenzyl esterase